MELLLVEDAASRMHLRAYILHSPQLVLTPSCLCNSLNEQTPSCTAEWMSDSLTLLQIHINMLLM
jgi:hypothetical protein